MAKCANCGKDHSAELDNVDTLDAMQAYAAVLSESLKWLRDNHKSSAVMAMAHAMLYVAGEQVFGEKLLQKARALMGAPPATFHGPGEEDLSVNVSAEEKVKLAQEIEALLRTFGSKPPGKA